MSWIDSHCHLDSIADDVREVLKRARKFGVRQVITVGTDLSTSRRSIELAEEYEDVKAVVGLHPHSSSEMDEEMLLGIERLAAHPKVVAVGEIGLDFYRMHSSIEDQERALAWQLDLAKRAGKAVVLHVRDAYREVVEILMKAGPPERLVFHCFSSGSDDARAALDLGAYLSFAGNVSFRSAEAVRESAALAPLDRILVETDSPYLAPVPFRGRPNEPAYVSHVGDAVAAARGVSADAVAAATSENAANVFSL